MRRYLRAAFLAIGILGTGAAFYGHGEAFSREVELAKPHGESVSLPDTTKESLKAVFRSDPEHERDEMIGMLGAFGILASATGAAISTISSIRFEEAKKKRKETIILERSAS